ncbi:L-type lectin-domain containing receptor kinase IV.2-like [Dioscorea cayenensis subsp. rotundata]|uniref:non-specific serine/threonine protein kinase n=1 Tax=Dioscorea cayennensis subsp. rotundata TaxID=55577 RepID=A0AB40CXQ5_DIOCR|nr:L-type lectin-domain containing receptor kinase IV.2-like [Dioscorea cayenensis subsp. rotundata]
MALFLRLGLSSRNDFTYNGFKGVNLSMDGLAGITPDALLMLANATSHAMSHVLFPSPLRFKKSQTDNVLSFSTTFVYAIIPEYQKLGSGGFTFVLSPSKDLTKASTDYVLAIVNMTSNGNASNHILAVEFDTWDSPQAYDINNNHVAININNIISNYSTPVSFTSDDDGKFQNLTLLSGKPMQIIKSVASGLQYLHEGWDQVVIHRVIKVSNVLLDGDMKGRLGDFGLARLYDHGAPPQTTSMVGTLGFLAPELARTCKVTMSNDVFTFGAFLLEVACGRRVIEPNKQELEQVFVEWVFANWKMGTTHETKDPRFGQDYVLEELDLVLKLRLFCSHPSPSARPSMRQITHFLNRDVPLPEMLPCQCHGGDIDSYMKQNDGNEAY